MVYYYSAFDLIIRADLPFPAFTRVEEPDRELDVSIEKVSNPANQADSFYYQFEETLHIWVTQGKLISYYTEEPWEERYICQYILDYALMGLFYQRGWFPLHGGTVVLPDGKAMIITGPSGAGKSTTVTQFAADGYPLLGDDIAVLRFEGDKIFVLPSYPEISVFEHVYEQYKNNFQILMEKRRWSMPNKVDFRPSMTFQTTPRELSNIVFLEKYSDVIPSFKRFSGSQAMQLIREQSLSYLSTIEKFSEFNDYFSKSSLICSSIPIYGFGFPRVNNLFKTNSYLLSKLDTITNELHIWNLG